MQSNFEQFPSDLDGVRPIAETGIDKTSALAGTDFGAVLRDRKIACRQHEACA